MAERVAAEASPVFLLRLSAIKQWLFWIKRMIYSSMRVGVVVTIC